MTGERVTRREFEELKDKVARHGWILDGNGKGIRARVDGLQGDVEELKATRDAIKWILVGSMATNVVGTGAIIAAILKAFGG